MAVKDYIKIRRLGTEKNVQELEKGNGYFLSKDSAITVIYHNGDPMTFLLYFEFPPNKIKGKHYHNKRIENMCIIKGTVKAKYFLPENIDDTYETELRQGDIVTILPGCAHAYLSEEGAAAVEFSPSTFDANDTLEIE